MVINLYLKIPGIFRINSGLWLYHFLSCSFFTLLHNFRCITFLTKSCLVLYYFWDNQLHSFILWFTVSSLSLSCCSISLRLFHISNNWSSSDSKFPQISKILLRIFIHPLRHKQDAIQGHFVYRSTAVFFLLSWLHFLS